MAKRLWGVNWGTGVPRHKFQGASATLSALNRRAKLLGKPLHVFHNSLSDFFDNEVPVQWRIDAMRAIIHTPGLIHLLLTKRIGNAAEMLKQTFCEVSGREWADNVLPNVWLGATICNQEEADRDIPKLLAVPAHKRFLSMEPLLGPVDLSALTTACDNEKEDCCGGPCHIDALYGSISCPACEGPETIYQGIDWVIVGGESGPNARPMHPDWARSLRDQCEAAGVPFLFKQWGEFLPAGANEADPTVPDVPDSRLFWSDGEKWDRFDGQRAGVDLVARVGKKAAGRLLDGIEWNGVPA